jgi:hypothetical protein
MNLFPQSDTTSILVRQLNCLLFPVRAKRPSKQAYKEHVSYFMWQDEVHEKQTGGINTLHRQNTTAIECCGQHVPNHLAIVQLFALHPTEQIGQDACTCKSYDNTFSCNKILDHAYGHALCK